MDIYDFIRSSDVAAHCQTIGKTWNTCEMAIIISRSNKSVEQKHTAWQELIDAYPDMPNIPNIHGVKFDSIHKRLEEIIEYNRLLWERFILPQPDTAYTYGIWSADSDASYDDMFSSYEKALSEAKNNWKCDEVDRIIIKKAQIDCIDGNIVAVVDYDGILYDLSFRAAWFPGYEDNELTEDVFEMFYIDIPTPFIYGDIVTCSVSPWGFKCNHICVLDKDSPNEEKQKEKALLGKCRDGTDLGRWGFFVSDDGVLYGDHAHNYDCFEYYNGKLEGNNRLLHYVSLYIKDEIDLPALLNVQCRIIAEHQLKNSFHINSHGSFIPEDLLAENQFTPDKK